MYVNVNCNGNKNTFVLVIVRYTNDTIIPPICLYRIIMDIK